MNRILKPVCLMVVLAMVLSLGMALALPVGAAASQSAINVASYDFNSLTGSDTSPFANLDGQDNWTSIGFISSTPQPTWYVGVTDTLGFDGTQALRFQRIGAGYGADASRLNDATFSIPDFDDANLGFFQADFGIGYWGNEFALAYDANSDGVIRKTDPSEIGPRLLVGSHADVQVAVVSADGSITKTPLSNANGAGGGDWLRLRLVIDFTANGGQGSGSVYYQNLTAGDTALHLLAGLEDVNLGLDSSATDARNPALWNAMWLHMEGATNELDNIVTRGGGPEGYLTGGGQITTGKGKNEHKVSFAGKVGYMEDLGLVGQWETNFHNVSVDSLDGARFHSTSITLLQFYKDDLGGPNPPPANFNFAHFTTEGMLNGEDGYTLDVWLSDRGEPGKSDAIYLGLWYGGGLLYNTLTDFPIYMDAAQLTAGNFQIH